MVRFQHQNKKRQRMLETIIQALPLKELTELYHVGTMDINNRAIPRWNNGYK